MSPLWRDEVGIFVGPRRVVLTRMGRGLRPACIAEQALQVEGGSFSDWEPSLAVLAASLSDARWQDGNARIVVANHWMRYALVPWSGDLQEDSERHAHAWLVLHEVYGDAVNGWKVALGETVPGRPQLACAMPAELHLALLSVVAAARLRPVSLQPHLVVSFDRWRDRVPAGGGWLVVIDDGTLAAARLDGEGWAEVHCVRIGDDWSAELKRLQTFGRLAGGHPDGGRVLVEAPYWLRRIASERDDSLEWLESGDGPAGTLEKLARLTEMNV